MILEERDYRVVPGCTRNFLATYETLELPLQVETLGGFVGYSISEIGNPNRVVALWRDDGIEKCDARRREMLAYSRWSITSRCSSA